MLDIVVVLVEPKNEGNIGAIARVMRNFGVDRLRLVNPTPIGDEAYRRAMHGRDILERARVVSSLAAALRGVDLVAGTTGIATRSEKKFVRIALTPKQFARRVRALDGTLGLLLGREDFGLFEKELERCDLLVNVPANPRYPVLNVSHAAAIILYELSSPSPTAAMRRASGSEKEVMFRTFGDLLRASRYPPHKRGRTQVMFRRLVGRAVPSKWEFHALMGVLTRAAKAARRSRGPT